jgi:hypothetical protein
LLKIVRGDLESKRDSESSSDCSESSETCWTSEMLLLLMHATRGERSSLGEVVAERAIANLVIMSVSVSRGLSNEGGRKISTALI